MGSTDDDTFEGKVLKSPNHYGLTCHMVFIFKNTLVSFISEANESSSENECSNEEEDLDALFDETEDDSDDNPS